MKDQYLSELKISNTELDIVRQFNMLVENNYKEQHQVQQYAALLHKSPKTLSNLFAQYNHSSPQQVIQDRITLEAKRLLYYTDKSSKEIANKLGFDEAANFSRFFKTATGISPSDFKETALKQLIGKD